MLENNIGVPSLAPAWGVCLLAFYTQIPQN